MPALLSLVVLGYRNFEHITRPCLDSLLPWLHDPQVELLVVDNGSPDGAAAKTAAWCAAHPLVRYLPSERNLGYAGGMNWGASQASGRWLLLVNNDTVFPALALDALKRVIRAAPAHVTMLGPVTNSAGNGQRLYKPDATHEEWLQIGQRLHEHPSHQLIPTYRCDFFCIAIRRDAWERLGGLSLDFGLGYYEDFDFSLRLRAAGYEQMITEDVFVLHAGSATFKGNAAARALIKQNKKLLQQKHPGVRFEHVRQGNLRVLQAYDALREQGVWTPDLECRRELRLAALLQDVPRNPLKRWLWQRKIKRTLGQVAGRTSRLVGRD